MRVSGLSVVSGDEGAGKGVSRFAREMALGARARPRFFGCIVDPRQPSSRFHEVFRCRFNSSALESSYRQGVSDSVRELGASRDLGAGDVSSPGLGDETSPSPTPVSVKPRRSTLVVRSPHEAFCSSLERSREASLGAFGSSIQKSSLDSTSSASWEQARQILGLPPASFTSCEKRSPQQIQIREITQCYYWHQFEELQSVVVPRVIQTLLAPFQRRFRILLSYAHEFTNSDK